MINKYLFHILLGVSTLQAGAQAQYATKPNPRGQLTQATDSTIPNNYITVPANPALKGNGIKRFLVGQNYRSEWTTPVTVHRLDFKKDFGGLTVKKEGGGKETKSLQVTDGSGREWALRSVQKYPANAIPEAFRKTFAETLVVDDISASFPYGALSMGRLSQQAGVPYLKGMLMYIGDEPALGKFREKFKNTLVLMEERLPSTILNPSQLNDKDLSKGTEEVVLDIMNKHDYKVDQHAVLRARILDNFVMDFDRHEGQWIWLSKDSGNYTVYYPVPKDRDQVFYTNQGLLPKFARGKGLFPELQGFHSKARNIQTFNRAARNFDHYFLNELGEDEWKQAVNTFLAQMTNQSIEEALHLQPAEIRAYHTESIIKKLEKKKKTFFRDMMEYYHKLSKKVAITGTNENEIIDIKRNDDRTVEVTVQHMKKDGSAGDILYRRTFNHQVTKEIDIYALEGDDRFVITGNRSPIKIRMIGGPGNDQFENHSGGGKVLAYDVNYENNELQGNIRDRINGDPLNNRFNRLDYNYGYISPGLQLEYSSDGGLFVGAKVNMIRQGFRKDPFASKQVFSVARAINSSSYHFVYKGQIVEIYKNTDLILSGDFKIPTSRTNFFGLGNETVFDKSMPGDVEFYRVKYDLAEASVLARTSWKSSGISLSYGPYFQYFKLRNKENENKYIAYPVLNGIDPVTRFKEHYYGGGNMQLDVDTRNNTTMPWRGIRFNTSVKQLFGLNAYSRQLTQLDGSFSFYTSIIPKGKLVFAGAVGGGTNIGDFEFEQAQYLGFKQNLRGYRIQRFAGRSRAYGNAELRWRAGTINAILFPASFGLLAFDDAGRVWTDGEISNTWHNGYGGGLWLAPVDKIVVTASLTYSAEEKNLMLISFSYQF